MIKIFTLLLAFWILPSLNQAIEIPLGEEREKIAYVNLHKLFETYPETEKARAELTKIVQAKKEEITQKKEEIVVLKSEVETLQREVALSTTSARVDLQTKLQEKESALSQAEANLPAFLTMSEEEIQNAEEGKTMALLAHIYKAIEALSKENRYIVVLDKDNILYGSETVDITPKILKLLENMK